MNEQDSKNSIIVFLETPPSLAAIFGIETSRWYIQQREITIGTVLEDALTLYALNYPGFRRIIFDPSDNKLNEGIQLTLNGVLFDLSQMMRKGLHEGDRITIIPAYPDEKTSSQ